MKWYNGLRESEYREAQEIIYGPENNDEKESETVVQKSNFNIEIGIQEEKKEKAFKILIFGVPGTPIFELGEAISDYYNVDLFELDRTFEDYFIDKIPSINFDTGDRAIGSGSQHAERDPETENRYRAIDRFLNVPNMQTEPLSFEDKMKIYSIPNGIIVSEIAEPVLLHWIQNGNGLILFLNIDEEKAVKWLRDRRKCFACGAAFHMVDRPPRQYEICDRCGTDLQVRVEDEPANVRHQFNIWRNDFSAFKKQMSKLDFVQIDIDSKKNFKSILDEIKIRLRNRYSR
jgi:ribosomal protein S27AE